MGSREVTGSTTKACLHKTSGKAWLSGTRAWALTLWFIGNRQCDKVYKLMISDHIVVDEWAFDETRVSQSENLDS